MLRAPESHTVDPDFDDVTVADLVNANPILAYYVARGKDEHDVPLDHDTMIQRILQG